MWGYFQLLEPAKACDGFQTFVMAYVDPCDTQGCDASPLFANENHLFEVEVIRNRIGENDLQDIFRDVGEGTHIKLIRFFSVFSYWI